jgi:hypothetical protein
MVFGPGKHHLEAKEKPSGPLFGLTLIDPFDQARKATYGPEARAAALQTDRANREVAKGKPCEAVDTLTST